MRRIDSTRRTAFSLLEMVLALAIAMLVLLALYFTLSTQLTSSQIGRETLAEGEVARSILARIAKDIANQMGATDPRNFPVYDTETVPADPADPASSTMPEAAPVDPNAAITFNFGIRGDASSVIISSYRIQRPAPMAMENPDAEKISDLRRVGIWLATNGSDPIGLARHELKQATSADLDTPLTDLQDQDKLVFAKEVRSIAFEYFDGTAWQTEWDGSAAAGDDGTARVGPPAAIKVTITLRKHNDPLKAAAATDNDQGPSFTHIIALPTGNSFPQPMTTTP